ncbi:MAG: aminoglycoside phosphotransferase family protein [Ignavibacteria bacterium]|nr:aminoglycoside phosphotransferase family protein [Ignavibacteria bacterium]
MSVRLPSNECLYFTNRKEQEWLPVLKDKLPFQIPELIGNGKPDKIFPYNWGIYRWIEGENAEMKLIDDVNKFAKDLAYFLTQLHKVEISNAPPAGQHCFYRGAPLSVYDAETKRAIKNLANIFNFINFDLATEIWDNAAKTEWNKSPVWFHGDFNESNLLVNNGKLSAVIDFGCCGIGDPSCDLVIAWTFLRGESREIFKSELRLDEAAWQRGRAWALWKALITIEESLGKGETDKTIKAKNTLTEIIKDYSLTTRF